MSDPREYRRKFDIEHELKSFAAYEEGDGFEVCLRNDFPGKVVVMLDVASGEGLVDSLSPVRARALARALIAAADAAERA